MASCLVAFGRFCGVLHAGVRLRPAHTFRIAQCIDRAWLNPVSGGVVGNSALQIRRRQAKSALLVPELNVTLNGIPYLSAPPRRTLPPHKSAWTQPFSRVALGRSCWTFLSVSGGESRADRGGPDVSACVFGVRLRMPGSGLCVELSGSLGVSGVGRNQAP